MKKLIKNERGFGAVEFILIIVVVGLIGGLGWYAIHTRKNKDNPAPISNTSTANTTTTKSANFYYGWKSYSKYGITFKYPADWKLTEANPSKMISLSVASPDHVFEGGGGDYEGKGGIVRIEPDLGLGGAEVTADNYKENNSGGDPYKSFDVITVNGKKAVQFQTVSAKLVTTIFFTKDKKMPGIDLKYAKDDYTNQFNTYNLIVNSVTLD